MLIHLQISYAATPLFILLLHLNRISNEIQPWWYFDFSIVSNMWPFINCSGLQHTPSLSSETNCVVKRLFWVRVICQPWHTVHIKTLLHRVAQVVVSWLAANEDQKNLWGPWDLEGIRTFVAKWDMSRIRAFWYCFDSDLTQTNAIWLRHLVTKMVTGASGPQ